MGPLVARVMKLFLHFHLVFTAGITFSYLVKVEFLILIVFETYDCSILISKFLYKTSFVCLQKLVTVSESDLILKFLEVKFGLNTTV